MSIAWTTALIIVLLLPGLFFFIGLAVYERLSREIVRSGVASEIGLAVLVAIIIHLFSIWILSAFGFRLSDFILPFLKFEHQHASSHLDVLARELSGHLSQLTIYIVVTALVGGALGIVAARAVMAGPLRIIATHKWIYDVIDANRKGSVVTAYVLTTTVQDDKVLMYRGRLKEFFLERNGTVAYIVLRNCARFYMTSQNSTPRTTKQLELFASAQESRPTASWAYLMIEGTNIANILFDSSPEIRTTDAGTVALNKALEDFEQALKMYQTTTS